MLHVERKLLGIILRLRNRLRTLAQELDLVGPEFQVALERSVLVDVGVDADGASHEDLAALGGELGDGLSQAAPRVNADVRGLAVLA